MFPIIRICSVNFQELLPHSLFFIIRLTKWKSMKYLVPIEEKVNRAWTLVLNLPLAYNCNYRLVVEWAETNGYINYLQSSIILGLNAQTNPASSNLPPLTQSNSFPPSEEIPRNNSFSDAIKKAAADREAADKKVSISSGKSAAKIYIKISIVQEPLRLEEIVLLQFNIRSGTLSYC